MTSSLNPAKKDFEIWKGATFDKTLTLYTGATTSTPAWDLTGYTASLDIKDQDGTVLLSLTTSNSRIVLGGTAGTIRLVIDATTTGALTWTRGAYDLALTTGSTVYVPIYGAFNVTGV